MSNHYKIMHTIRNDAMLNRVASTGVSGCSNLLARLISQDCQAMRRHMVQINRSRRRSNHAQPALHASKSVKGSRRGPAVDPTKYSQPSMKGSALADEENGTADCDDAVDGPAEFDDAVDGGVAGPGDEATMKRSMSASTSSDTPGSCLMKPLKRQMKPMPGRVFAECCGLGVMAAKYCPNGPAAKRVPTAVRIVQRP